MACPPAMEPTPVRDPRAPPVPHTVGRAHPFPRENQSSCSHHSAAFPTRETHIGGIHTRWWPAPDQPAGVSPAAMITAIATAGGKPFGDTQPNTTAGVLALRTRGRTRRIERNGCSLASLRHRHSTGSLDLTFFRNHQLLSL